MRTPGTATRTTAVLCTDSNTKAKIPGPKRPGDLCLPKGYEAFAVRRVMAQICSRFSSVRSPQMP